jgi:hypothetical protein
MSEAASTDDELSDFSQMQFKIVLCQKCSQTVSSDRLMPSRDQAALARRGGAGPK